METNTFESGTGAFPLKLKSKTVRMKLKRKIISNQIGSAVVTAKWRSGPYYISELLDYINQKAQ